MVAGATLLAATGAALTLATLTLLRPHLPTRRNHAGKRAATSAGLSFIPIILLMFVLAATGALELGSGGIAYLAYSLAAMVVGFADDLWGGLEVRGIRGHLGALARGRVTTGTVKVVVLGAGALLVAAAMFGAGVAAVAGAVVLAGGVNLSNLLDVRPGRALKGGGLAVLVLVFVASGGAILAAAGAIGGAIVLFYSDVRGRIMLGDAGAAVWGAVPGYLALSCGPGPVWWLALAVILGLTVLAEVSSISRWIEEVGVLRMLDLWGRSDE